MTAAEYDRNKSCPTQSKIYKDESKYFSISLDNKNLFYWPLTDKLFDPNFNPPPGTMVKY